MMTAEAEWLACDDPRRMLESLTADDGFPDRDELPHLANRKLRLFACACCRAVWHLLPDDRSRQAVEVAERFADGEVTEEDLAVRYDAAADAFDAADDAGDELWPYILARHVCAPNRRIGRAIAQSILPALGRRNVSRHTQAALLRDIVGNPFQPVSVPVEAVRCGRCGSEHCDHEGGECRCAECGSDAWVQPEGWLTPTVRAIAQAIYDERCFEELSILADALEDVGCDNEDMLRHCRGEERCPKCLGSRLQPNWGRAPAGCSTCIGTGWVAVRGPHARGCWVIDTILGKE